MDNPKKYLNEDREIDLFGIVYSLWINKKTIISSILIAALIAFLVNFFETKTNSVSIEISPNLSDKVSLEKLETFAIDPSEIFRNFLSTLKTKDLITKAIEFENKNISNKEISQLTNQYLGQIEIKKSENAIVDTFNYIDGFVFFDIIFTSKGEIEDKKVFLRNLIDQTNLYFIDKFINVLNDDISLMEAYYVRKINKKNQIMERDLLSQTELGKIEEEYRLSKFNLEKKYSEEKILIKVDNMLVPDIDKSELKLQFLIENYMIANDLNYKTRQTNYPVKDYIKDNESLFIFDLGTDVLSKAIESHIDLLDDIESSDPFIRKILNLKKNYAEGILKGKSALDLIDNNFKDANKKEQKVFANKKLSAKLKISEQDKKNYLLMGDIGEENYINKITQRDFLVKYLSNENVSLIRETSSFQISEEKNLLKYLLIALGASFLISSGFVFFNEARKRRNLPL